MTTVYNKNYPLFQLFFSLKQCNENSIWEKWARVAFNSKFIFLATVCENEKHP